MSLENITFYKCKSSKISSKEPYTYKVDNVSASLWSNNESVIVKFESLAIIVATLSSALLLTNLPFDKVTSQVRISKAQLLIHSVSS